jgi:hypothetical protein
MVSWQGWTQNIHDTLLILVAFASGINAIATRNTNRHAHHET